MINWKITNVEYAPSYEGLENVVANVHWYATCSQDGKGGYSYGNSRLNLETLSGDSFVNFDDLTEEVLLGWVFDQLGEQKGEVEWSCMKMLESGNFPEVNVGLPSNW